MDYLVEHINSIVAFIAAILGTVTTGGTIVSVLSFIKALKTEKTIKNSLEATNQAVKVTREGIVQAFKDAVVTKDVKVSINKQVTEILNTRLDSFEKSIVESEAKRTNMVYWCLKILHYTAANNQLTPAQQAEIVELLANIAEEEQIVDTGIL